MQRQINFWCCLNNIINIKDKNNNNLKTIGKNNNKNNNNLKTIGLLLVLLGEVAYKISGH